MSRYEVVFEDTVHGNIVEGFDSWDDAAEFWQSYADTETCVAGGLVDNETGETIWVFDDKED